MEAHACLDTALAIAQGIPGFQEFQSVCWKEAPGCRWMDPLGPIDFAPRLGELLLANYSLSICCHSAWLVCELIWG